MAVLLDSADVHARIDELLLSGRAQTAHEAEEIFLDEHLDDIVEPIARLDDRSLQEHEAITLLMSHGSRRLADAL
jgi:hypothetical protein